MEPLLKYNKIDHNLIERAEQFAESYLRPRAREFEDNGYLPREIIGEMAQLGFLASVFPKKYGGSETDPITYGLMTEAIGKGCCSTRTLLTVHTSLVGETLIKWGNKEQKEKWLPQMAKGEKIAAFGLSEPNFGSDARGIQTSYTKNGDHFIVNGRKKWISYAGIADFFIIIASSGKITSAFIVEKKLDGIKVLPQNDLLAGKASHVAEIVLDNVSIPRSCLLGSEGGGFSYITSTALDHGRYSIAWAGVAIAQEALEAMIKYSRNRSQFGQRIHNFQLIQGMIGDAVTQIHAARALCLKSAQMRAEKNRESVIETCIAKYFCSKVAMRVTSDALQIHGANGFTKNYPVERLYREAKILEIIEGSSQIMQVIIAKFGLGRYYN